MFSKNLITRTRNHLLLGSITVTFTFPFSFKLTPPKRTTTPLRSKFSAFSLPKNDSKNSMATSFSLSTTPPINFLELLSNNFNQSTPLDLLPAVKKDFFCEIQRFFLIFCRFFFFFSIILAKILFFRIFFRFF